MIAFACSNCGRKFEVKDEFAGRTTTCPTCKTAMTIPAPDTVAPVPAEPPEQACKTAMTIPGPDTGITTLDRGAKRSTPKASKGSGSARWIVGGLVLVMLLGVIGLAAAAAGWYFFLRKPAEPPWQVFVDPEKRFSVLMPGVPQAQDIPVPVGRRR